MFDFHSQNIKTCLEELKSDLGGLSQEEAEKRLRNNGLNEIPKKKPFTKLSILASQFKSSLIYILLIGGFLTLALKDYTESLVIFGAVIINVVIGFFQENKANDAINKLKRLIEYKTSVIRDKREFLVNSKEIVVGDIIIIKAGNRVPADARIIESLELKVNEANLTGESEPSAKKSGCLPKETVVIDRENMVYAGTIAVDGRGRAVVTSVGKDTELGKIALLVKNEIDEKTPLQERLTAFSKTLAWLFSIVCALIIIAGLWQAREFSEMIKIGVAVAVASIPEGLLIAVTFILALGSQQILKNKALTRKLVAAETLGSTTVICADKTGTLTEGKMSVSHIVIGEKEYEMNDSGRRQDQDEAREASLALQIGLMCNSAFIENPEDELKSWRIIGSFTEKALVLAAIQSGLRKEKILKLEPQIDELPFSSRSKFMASLHKKGSEGYILYEKGAPEILLKKSAFYHHHHLKTNLTDKERKKLINVCEALTGRGLRVIGLAYRDIGADGFKEKPKRNRVNWKSLDQDLVFIGFIALKDPLRPEAKDTINICRQAGIRPIIITGDHRLTAKAIAKEVGLEAEPENIIVGEELEKISDKELFHLVEKISVYARVSPEHKLRVVKALQKRGEVVAMTGDGINDSPALKAADIGIALGAGTDIAKENADLVLLDDNFKTIVSTIEQGRIIFKNIRKVITYLISDSFSEMVLIVGCIIFYTPLAIIPAQILWLNIVNDGLPHFSLAFEKGDKKTMREKPKKKNEPLLNREMKLIVFGVGLIRDVLLFAFFYYLYKHYYGEENIDYIRTLFFAIMGVKSLMGIFSIRRFRMPIWKVNPLSNSYLLLTVSASFLLLLFAIYAPGGQKLLATVDLGAGSWLIAFGFGLFNVLLIEAVKHFFIIKKERENSHAF